MRGGGVNAGENEELMAKNAARVAPEAGTVGNIEPLEGCAPQPGAPAIKNI